jgi:spore coat polysaccharide biosynthesis predicted glycosyltransferase SpsG
VTKISILSYVGKEFGSGHLVRSKALANRLRDLEMLVVLHVVNDDVRQVPFKMFSSSEIVIVDLPYSLQFTEIISSIQNQITIGLDWVGQRVLDYNIVLYDSPDSIAKNEVYGGLQYAIVRPEILEINRPIKRVKTRDYILTFGRSFAANSGEKIHRALYEEGLDGEIINPYFYERNGLSDYNSEAAQKLFIDSLLSAKTILTSGGVTLVESIFLGIEAISFPLNKKEEQFVEYLREIGCLKHVFSIDKMNAESYLVIKDLIQEANSNEPQECIDGLGVDRIAGIILEIQKRQ